MHNLDLQAELLQRRPHDLGQLVGIQQAGPEAVVQMIALPRTHPGEGGREGGVGGERGEEVLRHVTPEIRGFV